MHFLTFVKWLLRFITEPCDMKVSLLPSEMVTISSMLQRLLLTTCWTFEVAGITARVFKPKAMATCKRCKQVGHFARDNKCPARALTEIADTIEPFQGGANPLSNLYACPEGCVIPDGHYDFLTAEHHYQFN